MYLTDLADACRVAGLTVVELPGWQTRGRPADTGGFAPKGVLCHHTGSLGDGRRQADSMALVGRSDLPPPLCQLALDRQGVVYVCAAGRSNHAGQAKARGSLGAGDGNELYIGIEAMNSGTEGWSFVQYDAYITLCAALCLRYGFAPQNVRAHRETSVTGKWDPGDPDGISVDGERVMDMDEFRMHVAAVMSELRRTPKSTKPPTRGRVADRLDAILTRRIQAARDAGDTDKLARWKGVRSALRDRFPLR